MFQWRANIGSALIESVTVEVNGVVMDHQCNGCDQCNWWKEFWKKLYQFDKHRDLERQLFIELVSLPAGRHPGLPAGGVEYQRQLEQLSEMYPI